MKEQRSWDLSSALQRPGLCLPRQPMPPQPKLDIMIQCGIPCLLRPCFLDMYRIENRIIGVVFPQAFKILSVENAKREKHHTPRLSSC